MSLQSQIPALKDLTADSAATWFAALSYHGLLFHPEDVPSEIVTSSGKPLFSEQEAIEAQWVLEQLEAALGHETMVASAYPAFMAALGLPLDA